MTDPKRPHPPSSAPATEDDASEWRPPAAQLDATGRLSGPPRRAPAAAPGLEEPDPAGLTAGEDEPLELVDRPPPAEPSPGFDPTPGYEPLPNRYEPKRRRLFPIAMGLFALVIAAAGALVLFRPGILPRGLLPRSVSLPRLEAAPTVLTIESTPSGATVFLNGVETGETPLAMENAYARGAPVEVKLVLRGYRPWTGTFPGGATANVQAKLQKR